MEVTNLYDNVIKNANSAKTNFVEGKIDESFLNLLEITKCIDLLGQLRINQHQQNVSVSFKQNTNNNHSIPYNATNEQNEPKRNFVQNDLNSSNKIRKSNAQGTKQKHKQFQRPPTFQEYELDPVIKDKLNTRFYEYLMYICSKPNITDTKGEKIHQTLQGKKVEKVDHTEEFVLFRFRIQSFQNGLEEYIKNETNMEKDLKKITSKQIKNYLLNEQKIISRYNEDGRKSKSKGNHVWNLKAKKVSSEYWQFQPFFRKIGNFPMPKAIYNKYYCWTPWVWDPQMRVPRAAFHSPWLPSWLNWEGNKLCGTPVKDATDCQITVVAECIQGNEARNNAPLFSNKNIEVKLPDSKNTTMLNTTQIQQLNTATSSISDRLLGSNRPSINNDHSFDYDMKF